MTEKLAFHQRFRQSPAVDYQKWLVGAPSFFVDQTRHPLLARPALPRNQHRGLRIRYLLDYLHDSKHPRTSSHPGLVPRRFHLRAQCYVFRDNSRFFRGFAHPLEHFSKAGKWLRHEIVCTTTHRIESMLVKRGHHDDFRRFAPRFRRFQHFEPIAIRHPQVRQHHRKRRIGLLNRLDR
ncbi:MAG: hypothetical protein BWY17_05144 [Deltaproteobacteria bacterium ADurb.Bin207]|nr:MAG: hypothetical protein BWY17_05144 [Deltaproteobacteria bacterium ADurb.Bin207]